MNPATSSELRPPGAAPPETPAGILTVADVIACYQKHAPPFTNPESAKDVARFLAHFVRDYGTRPAADLKPYDLFFWINANKQWAANNTKNRVKIVIQRPFNFCARLGLIDRNPLAGVAYPEGERGRDLSDQEFRALLKAGAADLRRVLFFLRLTGARPVELRRLEWDQVRAELGAAVQKLHKTSYKSKPPRRIPLTPVVLKLLDWMRRHAPPGEKHVFLNRWGRPWRRQCLCKRFRTARKKVGLPADVKLYGNRHAFGTQAVLNDVDIATVAQLMGHASVTTTERYVHLANKDAHLAKAALQAVRSFAS